MARKMTGEQVKTLAGDGTMIFREFDDKSWTLDAEFQTLLANDTVIFSVYEKTVFVREITQPGKLKVHLEFTPNATV